MYSSSINKTSSNSTNQRNIVDMFSNPLVEARRKDKEETKKIKERKKNNIEKVLEKIIKKYQSQCRLFKKQELPLTMGLLLKLTLAPYKLGINKIYNKLMTILNSYEENDLLIHLLPELSQFKKGSVSNPYKLVEINQSYTPIISYKMAEKIEAEYNLDIKLKDKLHAVSSKIIYEGTTK